MADDDKSPPRLGAVIGSIFAAAIGIQSNRNRERDFSRGRARHYVIVGLVGTLLFVLTVYLAVKLVLRLAAA